MVELADIIAIKPVGLYPKGAHDRVGFGGLQPLGLPPVLADLLRVPVRYLLEIWEMGKLVRAVALPLDPENISVDRPTPTEVTYTFGVNPVREHSLHKYLRIEAKGRTGLAYRTGHNRKGEIVFKDGPGLMREFDAFLDYYQQRATELSTRYIQTPDSYRESRDPIWLVFRALEEKLHARVEVVGWRWSRNKDTSRLGGSAEWVLTLNAYASQEPKEPGNFIPGAEYVAAVTETLNMLNNYLALGPLLLNNARADLDVLRGPFQALQRTGGIARATVEATKSVLDFPRALMADIAIAAGQFSAAWQDMKRLDDDFLTGLDAATSDLADAFWGSQEMSVSAVTSVGVMGGGPTTLLSAKDKAADTSDTALTQPTIDVPSVDIERERGTGGDVLLYTVSPGDTVADIAEALLGSRLRSLDIILLNNMLDSRTMANGSPLVPGLVLKVPGTGQGRQPFLVTNDLADVFGRDFYLDPNTGDFEVAGSGTDVRTVHGVDNLDQALRNRLSVKVGSTPWDGYGVPDVPEGSAGAVMLGYIAAHLRKQLVSDPRIEEVNNLVVADDGDRLVVFLDVEPITGDALEVEAPLG